MKIILFTLEFGGFGDIIFSFKIYNFLINKGHDVRIMTFWKTIQKFKNLIKKNIEFIGLNRDVCSFVQYDDLYISQMDKQKVNKYDLIIIAPLNSSGVNTYEPLHLKIENIFLHEIPLEKIKFITEYNVYDIEDHPNILKTGLPTPYKLDIEREESILEQDLNLENLGILITNPEIHTKILEVYGLKAGEYAFVWISVMEGVTNCLISFLDMISDKWQNKNKKLKVLVPEYFKNRYIHLVPNSNIELVFIFPVEYKYIPTLMKYSIPDILVTGDQSVSDVISCCENKIIWYQIAPWKITFAEHFFSLLERVPTLSSCGSLECSKPSKEAILYIRKNLNFFDFLENVILI